MRRKFRLFRFPAKGQDHHHEVPVESTFGEIAIVLMKMKDFLLIFAITLLAAMAASLQTANRDQQAKAAQIAELQGQLDTASAAQKERDQSNAHLQHRLDELETKPIGQFAVEANIAAKEVQKLKLLLAWQEIRVERDMHQLLHRLQSAQQIVLAGDHRALPADERFAALQKEAARIFRAAEKRGVAPAEIAHLLKLTGARAGFGPTGLRQGVNDPALVAYGKGPKVFHADVLHQDNLDFVTETIRHSLLEERVAVGKLQHEVVDCIAWARLGQRPATTDPREAQRKFIAELDIALDLLPETVERELSEVR